MEERPTTKMEWVAQQLRSAINEGRIAPGEHIRVMDWSSRLHVSATPLREALKVLAVEGFVVLSPHQGAVATSFSSRDFEDATRIRAALDGLAAKFTIDRQTESGRAALVKRMSSMTAKMRTAFGHSQAQRVAALSSDFNELLYESSNSPQLRRSRALLYTHLPVARNVFWRRLMQDAEAFARYMRQKDDIIADIGAEDQESAAARCADHAMEWSAWLRAGAPD